MGKQKLFTDLKKLHLVPRYHLSKLATTCKKYPKMTKNGQNTRKIIKTLIFSIIFLNTRSSIFYEDCNNNRLISSVIIGNMRNIDIFTAQQ